MNQNIIVETERTSIALLDKNQASLIRDYYLNNQAHLLNWEPVRSPSFYDLKTWQRLLCEHHRLFEEGAAIKLVVLNHRLNLKNQSDSKYCASYCHL